MATKAERSDSTPGVRSSHGDPHKKDPRDEAVRSTAKKTGEAFRVGLTDIEYTSPFTDKAVTFHFRQTGGSIDGFRFPKVEASKPHEEEYPDVTSENATAALDAVTPWRKWDEKSAGGKIASVAGTALTLGVLSLLGYIGKGLWHGGKMVKENVPVAVKNEWNRRARTKKDHLILTQEEREGVIEGLRPMYLKYKDSLIEKLKKHKGYENYDFDKCNITREVTHMRAGVALKKDGARDFDKCAYFYVCVKRRDKDGKYVFNNETPPKNKIDIIYLHYGPIPEDEVDHVILVAADKVDWVMEGRTYFTEEQRKRYLKEKYYYPEVKTAGAEDTDEASSSSRTSRTTSPSRSAPTRGLTCFAHAVKVLTDTALPRDAREREFAKPKVQRDREASDLARAHFAGVRQEDAHEALMRSGLFGDSSRFRTTSTRYYMDGSGVGAHEISTGTARDEDQPVPILSITPERDLQVSFNSYVDCRDRAHLPTMADPRNTLSGEVQVTRQTRMFTTNPPFLMVTVNRIEAQRDPSTHEVVRHGERVATRTITDPIAVPDRLLLTSGTHIQGSAIDDAANTNLDLKGFISHDLASADGGHYITYIQRQIPGDADHAPRTAWFKYDNLGDYGVEVADGDREFDRRKRTAYIYLYKNPTEG